MFKSYFASLDGHMQEVVRGTAIAFILKVLGAGLAFGFNVTVARLVGAEGAGLYFLALAITAIASVIGRVGLDNALLRFVATHATHEEWGKVKGIYALGMRMAISVSVVVTLALFLSATWLSEYVFNKPELSDPLRWLSLSILPFVLLNLQAESLKGLKQIRDATVVQSVGLPLLSLSLIYPLVQISGVVGVVWAYSAGAVVVAVLGIWWWHRSVSVHKCPTTRYSLDELWLSCKPLFMVSLLNRAVLPWAPLFILGIWASSEEVGVFGAASRVAMLVGFMLVTINNVVAPKFAELFAKGDLEALGQMARRSALMVSVLASPIFVVLIFGGDWVMLMFGPSFEQGALVLSILAIGQFINLITGSVGYMLIITGKEKVYFRLTAYSVIMQMLLLVVFVPIYHDIGAAIASSLSLVYLNLAAAWVVYKKTGIVTIPLLKVRSNAG